MLVTILKRQRQFLGKTKIKELELSTILFAETDVLRFQIPVDDSLGMDIFENACQLPAERKLFNGSLMTFDETLGTSARVPLVNPLIECFL